MSDKNKTISSLKNRFKSTDRKMNTDSVPDLKHSQLINRLSFDAVDISKKTLKTSRKSVDNASRQLERNKAELLILTDSKESNHHKLEKLISLINASKAELHQVENTIIKLQKERISDEVSFGKLHSKRIKIEGLINSRKREKEIKQKIEDKKKQASDVIVQVYYLQGHCERIRSHINDLNEELILVKNKYSETARAFEEVREEKSGHLSRRDSLLNSISDKKTEHTKNALELNVRIPEKFAIDNEVTNLTRANSNLEKEISGQREKIDNIPKTILKLEREKVEICDNVKLEELNRQRFEIDILQLQKEATTIKDQWALQSNKYKALKKSNTQAINSYTTKPSERDEWIAKQKNTLSSIQKSNENISFANSQVELFHKKIEELKIDIVEKKADVQEYAVYFNNLSQELERVKSSHDDISVSYKKSLIKRSEWSSRIENRQKVIAEIQNKIEDKKEKIFLASEEIDGLKINLESMHVEVASLNNEYAFSDKQLQMKKSQKVELVKDFTKLSNSIENLQTMRSSTSKEIKLVEVESNKKKIILTNLEEQSDTVQSAISGAKTKYNELTQHCNALKAQVDQKVEVNAKLQIKFEQVATVTLNLQKEVKAQKEVLQNRFDNLVNERMSLEVKNLEKNSILGKLVNRKRQFDQAAEKAIESKRVLIEESNKLNNKIDTVKTSVEKKSLEVQMHHTDINSSKEKNSSQETQLTKLNERSEKLNKRVQSIQSENSLSLDMIRDLSGNLRDIHIENTNLASEFEKENTKKRQLKNNISKLNNEIYSLKESVITESNRVVHSKNTRVSLEQKYLELKNQKETLLDQIEEKAQTYNADESISKSSIKEKKIKTTATNIDEVYSLVDRKIKGKKSSSVMITSIREVVEAISVNEFSNLKWGAKISEGASQYGAKIRFRNMSTQYSELKAILKPVIEKVSRKFKAYGMDIKTKTKTSPGEVIEALEITFIVDKAIQKKTELRS